MAPGEIDEEMTDRLDEIVGHSDLETLPDLDIAELERIHDELEALEREVSDRRRALFDRIDRLQAEVTRRYRTGEASVESLLQ
jgi:hypothetical protein